MSESTKKIRCAAVITNDLGQLLVFGWITETPELPPSSTPDSEPCPVWLAKKKEQQLAANLWNVYSHPTDLALSIALMQRSQLDMTNAQ